MKNFIIVVVIVILLAFIFAPMLTGDSTKAEGKGMSFEFLSKIFTVNGGPIFKQQDQQPVRHIPDFKTDSVENSPEPTIDPTPSDVAENNKPVGVNFVGEDGETENTEDVEISKSLNVVLIAVIPTLILTIFLSIFYMFIRNSTIQADIEFDRTIIKGVPITKTTVNNNLDFAPNMLTVLRSLSLLELSGKSNQTDDNEKEAATTKKSVFGTIGELLFGYNFTLTPAAKEMLQNELLSIINAHSKQLEAAADVIGTVNIGQLANVVTMILNQAIEKEQFPNEYRVSPLFKDRLVLSMVSVQLQVSEALAKDMDAAQAAPLRKYVTDTEAEANANKILKEALARAEGEVAMGNAKAKAAAAAFRAKVETLLAFGFGIPEITKILSLNQGQPIILENMFTEGGGA